GHSPAATRLALLNACVIAAYTTIDGLGVRASRAPVAYSLWLSLLVGLPWLVWVAMRRDYRWADARRQLPAVALGGACSVASYTLALWAMTRAPVAAVAAVRETSIVFGDRKSTRLNSSHLGISYAVFCLKKKKKKST